MKTQVMVKVTSSVQDLEFGIWDTEGDEFISLHGMDTDETTRMAERLGCSTALIDALVMFTEAISDLVGIDLVDIWKRLDKLEQK